VGLVKDVQAALQENRLYRCPQCKRDGIFGHSTKEAVKEFQKAKGLTPSGALTVETLRKLGVRALHEVKPRL
jgi:peptidoglycan hydrolase-like protein with peptidoglycan-binding domain